MDFTQAVTHIGLCAGYGGIELGLRRVIRNLRTVALCEVEAFAIANLVVKMEAGHLDASPIWTDLKTFPYETFHGRVDILTGGYPCQPFSAAGKRLGSDDPRHLWPHIARGIRLLQPRLCFFENVEGHISLGLSDVIEDLARMGYRTTWGIFSASECGAPHQRKRVFILAHSSSWRGKGLHDWLTEPADAFTCGNGWPSRPNERQHFREPPRVVANSRCERQEERQINPDRSSQSGQRQTQPSLGRDADGSSSGMDYAELCVTCDNRTDELRLLGNGVVPATAALAFRTLAREILG